MSDRKDLFLQRKQTFDDLSKKAAQAVRKWSAFRIISFILALSVIIYFANVREAWPIAVAFLAFVVVFGIFVNQHNKALRNYAYQTALAETNNDEVLRLESDLKGFAEGSQFHQTNHPYAADLDIFGRYSIFQLLNRTTTPLGEEHLANWLKTPSNDKEVDKRQQGVRELKDNLEWRQSFEATGRMNFAKSSGDYSLLQQLAQPAEVSGWLKIWAGFSIIISLFIYTPVFLSAITWQWVGLALILNSVFLVVLARWMSTDYKRLTGVAKRLSVYVDLFHIIEKATFESRALTELKAHLFSGHLSASEAFRSLSATLNRFDNRSNFFYQLLNAFLLLDYWLVLRANSWFKQNGTHVKGWLEASAEIEAFNSVAGYAYANPAFVFPTITPENFQLNVEQMGHPLIPQVERISNNFTIAGKGLFLITGSNMSGKSTFLRTVGVNVVLALAGAPVCATKMVVSYMQVFTSMRTQDALEESVSSFYAELKRIRQLLDLLDTEAPVLYMLDEVLKGTNSDDRHKGTEALVHQLLKKNAAGFISTHDLSLSHLGEDLSLVHNYSFNNFIEGDRLIFDYKINEGPCRSFNASQLMKNMGIEIIP